MYLLGRGRVRFTQAPVHPSRSFFLCFLFQTLSHRTFFRVLGKINIFYYGLDIKSCTSGENRDFTFCVNFIHGLFCHLLEPDDMKLLPGIQHIDEIMRNTVHLLFCDLGRADIHMAVHLHGICGDDFSVCRMSQGNGQAGLAHRRRPCQYD